ncbi:MAG: thermonuclease family protein [Candidatus Nanoarchaeia archaeon]
MTYRRLVTRIVDGDTFEIGNPIQGFYRVRLARVRASELNTTGGQRAKNVLRGLIGGANVTIQVVAKSYGRVVAEVYHYGRNINDIMRSKGYR